ncbi:MAG: methylated-DNA--[protein]-cysteine S-methyltransferase [Planctomycetaceae bacterium]|jgi:methylated-DNA-[protein]-cysteine S-methyltransferase|nr:methylated-DNA--[protein]-cysteine S-methyltransferase [Planctomycetaceae bacterium]
MNNEQKWQAVAEHDDQYDGLFFVGVKSTKIFCQPSCKSKLPLRKNVLFFENVTQAKEAGYRSCKRCRPDLLDNQHKEIVETEMEYIHKIKSPVGILTVSSNGQRISGLWMEGQKYFAKTLGKDISERNLPIFKEVRKWLDIYFSGKEPDFMLPLIPKGSPFQQSIWDRLCKIPYGQTTTYGEIAIQFELEHKGKHTSARAVGNAVGHNPVSILIPCHRVIGKNGYPTGYAGGIDKKIKLLKLEGINIKNL